MPKRVIQVYPKFEKPGMHWEKIPNDIWLPFTRHNSEVFQNKLTGQKLHRFNKAVVLYENDDAPDDDLLEDLCAMPAGYVGWSQFGMHYANPLRVGDEIQVLDPKTDVVMYTEVIEEVRLIEGWEFSIAKKVGGDVA